MKLDDIDFSALAKLLEKMGAPLIPWTSGVSVTAYDPGKWEQIRTTGIEVQLSEVKSSEQGLLTYEGRHILLYIKDTPKAMGVVMVDPASLQKFHFFDCSTLDRMRAANRFERYVVTQCQTGDFLLDVTDPHTRTLYKKDVIARLHVCRDCLSGSKYQNYKKNLPQSRRDEIVENFNIAEFFQKYNYSFRGEPARTAETAPPNRYPVDWEDIAREHKSRVHWRCQECPVDLSEHRHLLHVHHINGVRTDNRASNLRVLCVECHSQQPQHQHLKSRFSRELIELREIRRWQGLAP
jgi:hypothetical protein